MAKYNIYAVGYGINPDTKEPVSSLKCTNWPDCQKYIKGVPDAKYKGFITDEEADAWLAKFQEDNTTTKPDVATPWQEKAEKVYESKIHPIDQNFSITCKELGIMEMDVEHFMKKMFVDTVQFLKDHDCINELPFK